MDLTGKRALVTGGGRGIGAAVARALAGHGADVIICGRASAPLEQVANAIGATPLICDLGDRPSTDALVATVAGKGGSTSWSTTPASPRARRWPPSTTRCGIGSWSSTRPRRSG